MKKVNDVVIIVGLVIAWFSSVLTYFKVMLKSEMWSIMTLIKEKEVKWRLMAILDFWGIYVLDEIYYWCWMIKGDNGKDLLATFVYIVYKEILKL
jgi:hypothetical protein